MTQLALGDWTLAEARAWLADRLDHGERCPCCEQFAKVYTRAIPSATARVLIALYRRDRGDGEYLFLPPILETLGGTPSLGGYGTLGHFWGLLETMPGEREDGSNRVGWWRLTELGRSFVRGAVTVPKYARIYNGTCLGLTGEAVTIEDALGERFDYRELMAA